MQINTASMIGYTTYMQDRAPSPETKFWTDDYDGDIYMLVNRSDGQSFMVEFVDETKAKFIFETKEYDIYRLVSKPGEFTSAMIEFSSVNKDHFDEIINRMMGTMTSLSKLYHVTYKEVG